MIEELKGKSILAYDIEANGLNVLSSECKWFGAYSYKNDKYYLLPYTEMDLIKKLIQGHNKIFGYNNKEYDNPILINQHDVDINKYKNVLDFFHICKQRLPIMGIKVENYKMDTVVQKLGFNKKGEIDYEIFKKDEWTAEEIVKIKKYLKQDIDCTKFIFEWFFKQFKPLREFLSAEDQDKFMDVKASPASLAYRVMCNLSGKKCEFPDYGEDEEETEDQYFCGGHHIEPRVNKASGNLVSIDITSAYPHAIMMGNLLSPSEDGWDGDGYFNLRGKYNNKEFGKVEEALNKVFLTRLKAKQEGDKIRSMAYKIVINSFYGTLGRKCFKTFYNPIAAGDCTSMIRTIIKKLAKTCEENGYEVKYGFTDNIVVLIPNESSKEELMVVVDSFLKDMKKHVPFPLDTFKLEIDKEYKFIQIFAKNCYVWVDSKDKVGYTSTVFNKNTPKVISDLFENYMAPKIAKDLDVMFTEEELRRELMKLLNEDISLAGTKETAKALSEYKNNTSKNYQVAERYGEGTHILIPNLKMIGIGKAKGTKKKIPVRHCTIKEFEDNNLKIEDIDVSQLLKHVKLFIGEATA